MRIRIKWLPFWALGLAISLSEAVLRAEQFSELVVFGDSNSDTGNLIGERFSNGPVWVEELAFQLGLDTPTASTAGGTNYAWGGARTGFGIKAISSPSSFGLTNVTDPALQMGVIVPNADEYMFFNDFHFTTRFHQMLGTEAVRVVIPETSSFVLATLAILSLLSCVRSVSLVPAPAVPKARP